MDFKKLTATAKQFARRNPEKVDQALDRAGDFVDRRTGRKYERHVNTVQQKARQFLGGERAQGGPAADRPAEQAEGPAPGPDAGSGGTPGDRPGGTGGPDRGPRT